MFDTRIERQKADRSIQALMVSSLCAAVFLAVAILALAGLGFAVLILGQ